MKSLWSKEKKVTKASYEKKKLGEYTDFSQKYPSHSVLHSFYTFKTWAINASSSGSEAVGNYQVTSGFPNAWSLEVLHISEAVWHISNLE